MKRFDWDLNKNYQLIKERGISFEDVVYRIQGGGLLTVLEHPNKKKYGHQKLFVVEMNGYAYAVPFVENETTIFLKTIFPSRKLTRFFLG
jgi:uncharacterized DUF497 family protein